MKISKAYIPIIKETPSEAEIDSHRLMLRAGLIRQTAAGIYAWLPLGLRVLRKIENIVRREQNRVGCVEMLMPTVQSADLWQRSGRYEAYGPEMLRFKDRHERDMLYGPTNEEMIADIFLSSAKSYRDLPKMLYHIQWKFRDERRPRFGVMRGREFLMKDAYSFDFDEESMEHSYQAQFDAYIRTFAALGLKAVPVRAPTGPIGGSLSHEFHVLANTGESEIYYDAAIEDISVDDPDAVAKLSAAYAMEEEEHKKQEISPELAKRLVKKRGIEVGHIFSFGSKYTESMGFSVQGPDGENVHPLMGSYGIGVSRLVGAIIEGHNDDNGIIWPEEVAPYRVGLINLRVGDEACDAMCDDIYAKLQQADIELLYDDTDERAGGKFAKMDLIGLPWQFVVGPKSAKAGIVEVKNRRTGERQELSIADALQLISGDQ